MQPQQRENFYKKICFSKQKIMMSLFLKLIFIYKKIFCNND